MVHECNRGWCANKFLKEVLLTTELLYYWNDKFLSKTRLKKMILHNFLEKTWSTFKPLEVHNQKFKLTRNFFFFEVLMTYFLLLKGLQVKKKIRLKTLHIHNTFYEIFLLFLWVFLCIKRDLRFKDMLLSQQHSYSQESICSVKLFVINKIKWTAISVNWWITNDLKKNS